MQKKQRISVIIPSLNEQEVLAATLNTLKNTTVEAILSDGGSSDKTLTIARDMGLKLLSSPPGRASQLNHGAHAATGDIFLFLHADTLLPEGFEDLVQKALEVPGVTAGAFRLSINSDRGIYRLIEAGVHFRSTTLQMPYGDQALFMKRAVFRKAGGFPPLQIMEDYSLVRTLRKQGRIHILQEHVTTSARRWRQQGAIATTIKNQCMIAGFLLGISPGRLARFYSAGKKF
ncbi:MAG: TIGR04283 family arsenosugar biosynthesis glycosyltransferase [Desulfobulbaceae bacterium]|uniref:TIGR04283 family arsenosugar biosynthesis glycosyltransferase n=1 Tax=Candidatus Desulfobia pelagia TaxID=2841692 RepID=A0A8J6NGE1_9BACT|nr:TIGR04283 family arsenosugar biosynthesis glycosyltransferase [Candidatus Desulfobia pelagia]